MKKKLLSIMTILASGLAFGQTIPNGGFESWTTLSYEEPTHYQTSNSNNNNGNFFPANAIKTTDAFHANYAIKLSTVLEANSDTAIAYFCNGNPGQTPAQGGIPYTQKPTGIRLHYKSNIIGTDSALILVVFKKGGANLATYFWKIGASQSSYTLFSKTFSPALTVNPDTVIFGATSSDPFNNNYKGTPGNMMQIDSISFIGAPQPATLNGDLEQWQSNSMDLPNGWTSEYAAKSTDAYTGTYAIELQTTAPGFGGGGGIHPGNATSGKYTNSGPVGGGHPYSKQIDTLVFYYKYLPADPNDTATIYVNFKKNGFNFWNAGTFMLQASVYTRVSIPFDLTTSGNIPDSCVITFQSSNKWPAPASYIGSDLKIDNMYFVSQTKPVSNFIMPAKGCVGVPIQLNDSSSNMVTSWNWIMGGGSPSSSVSQNPIVTYNTIGTHTVHMNASNSFGSGPTSSKTITIYALPNVAATTPSVCLGNQAIMTASGANTYTWSTGATTATISASPTVTTTYTVTGTDINGCSNTDVESITILTAPVPNICMVSTDSLSINNIIYWDKTPYANVDSFIAYREVSSNVYKRIGAQPYSALSQFIDTARYVDIAGSHNGGNPNSGTYRYKLQTRDTCGNYSLLSPYHNTIYISHTGGQFSWTTPYQIEGQASPDTNYVLSCDTANTNVWTSVASVSGSQQTVADPGYIHHSSIANWRVDALGFNCNPTLRLAGGNNSTYAAKVKSHSNQNNNRIGGINKIANNNSVSIYPNPASNALTISFASAVNKASVKIFSVIGSEVLSTNQASVGTSLSVDISNLASGTYMVQIITDNATETKKIVKQ